MSLFALLAAVAAYWPGAAQAEQQIRAERLAFNRAIAAGYLDGIAAVLAPDVQMVTGADSIRVANKLATPFA